MSALVQAIPEPVLAAFWPLIAVAFLAVVFWRAFVWLINRIDERFKAAINSQDFEHVVDRRVAAGFQGALAPLLTAHGELAGKIAVVEKSAARAHERIDEILKDGAT